MLSIFNGRLDFYWIVGVFSAWSKNPCFRFIVFGTTAHYWLIFEYGSISICWSPILAVNKANARILYETPAPASGLLCGCSRHMNCLFRALVLLICVWLCRSPYKNWGVLVSWIELPYGCSWLKGKFPGNVSTHLSAVSIFQLYLKIYRFLVKTGPLIFSFSIQSLDVIALLLLPLCLFNFEFSLSLTQI